MVVVEGGGGVGGGGGSGVGGVKTNSHQKKFRQYKR